MTRISAGTDGYRFLLIDLRDPCRFTISSDSVTRVSPRYEILPLS